MINKHSDTTFYDYCKYAYSGWDKHSTKMVRGEEGQDVASTIHIHPVRWCPKCGNLMEHITKPSYPHQIMFGDMLCLNDECGW